MFPLQIALHHSVQRGMGLENKQYIVLCLLSELGQHVTVQVWYFFSFPQGHIFPHAEEVIQTKIFKQEIDRKLIIYCCTLQDNAPVSRIPYHFQVLQQKAWLERETFPPSPCTQHLLTNELQDEELFRRWTAENNSLANFFLFLFKCYP